jgi:hypothetical protein
MWVGHSCPTPLMLILTLILILPLTLTLKDRNKKALQSAGPFFSLQLNS